MGIKLLNTFIKTKCKNNNSISKVHLCQLKGKKIAVDTSIYMYRYLSENSLIENFYTLCSIFYKYEIIPIFVFDGKPPIEKQEEITQRKDDKKNAKETFKKLEIEYNNTTDNDKKKELKNKMNLLKKQFVKLTKQHTDEVKLLIEYFGMTYITAISEADTTCAYLELTAEVDAILSEDMDLFAYGCSKIMRYFSLINHNCLMYNIPEILKDIGISKEYFKQLCYVSGNDYLKSEKNIFLYYDEIQKVINNIENKNIINKEYIYDIIIEFDNNIDMNEIKKVEKLYTINNDEYKKYYNNINIIRNEPCIKKLILHIEKYGFMYPSS